MATQHYIQKQILEVVARQSDQQTAVTGMVAELYNNKVIPKLEALFDRLAPSGKTIVIDRLEIEAAPLAWQDLDAQLPRYILEAMERALVQELEQIPLSDNEPAKGPVQHPAKEISMVQVFTTFMEEGSFPWWYEVSDFDIFELELRKNCLPAVFDFLKTRFHYPTIKKRLFYQFSESFIKALIQQTIPVEDQQLWEHPLYRTAPRVFGEKLLEWAFPKVPMGRLAEDLAFFLHDLPKKPKEETNIVESSTERGMEETDLAPVQRDEYYVNNAGLVILAPYLEIYLDHFGYLQNGRFADERSREYSVHLLEYLASGREQVAESELLFHKFLCGLPLHKPIDRYLKISEVEKAEAEKLLTAVINNWPELKNTDIPTLRAAFLQRNGKLYRKNNEWRLRVEQQTHDVLLNYLPWSISVIQLPWLDEMVWVEWG